jgi:hypothetical protein
LFEQFEINLRIFADENARGHLGGSLGNGRELAGPD